MGGGGPVEGTSPWQASSLWWRVPVQRSRNHQGETMFDRSNLSERGPTRSAMTTLGAPEPPERNCGERKTHTHTVRGQMEVHTQTNTHTQQPAWEGKLTEQGHRGEFISVLRPLHTERLPLTHLYSVMIMQCHAGTDYVQVSEGEKLN